MELFLVLDKCIIVDDLNLCVSMALWTAKERRKEEKTKSKPLNNLFVVRNQNVGLNDKGRLDCNQMGI